MESGHNFLRLLKSHITAVIQVKQFLRHNLEEKLDIVAFLETGTL